MVYASTTNLFAKEMAIRKRIASIFNKREDDFPSLKEYNDYLEEVEDITCNFIEGVDVAIIEAKVAKYEQENAEQITNARARKAEELAAALADTEVGQEQYSQTGQPTATQGQYAHAMAGGQLMQPRPMGMGPQPIPKGVDGLEDGARNSVERGRSRKHLLAYGCEVYLSLSIHVHHQKSLSCFCLWSTSTSLLNNWVCKNLQCLRYEFNACFNKF